MSTRIPLPHSHKIIELFRNPKNMGYMDDASVKAIAGSPACGDMIAIYLKIDDGKETVVRASFESYGCAANIATASILTEMIKGLSLEEAWNISWKNVSDELGGLPSIKYHCGILAVGALRRAIREYYKSREVKSKWLPEKLTREELQALGEERIVELMYKRMGSE